jgi:hypothetical protein
VQVIGDWRQHLIRNGHTLGPLFVRLTSAGKPHKGSERLSPKVIVNIINTALNLQFSSQDALKTSSLLHHRDRLMGDLATRRPTQLATSYITTALADELPVLAAGDTRPRRDL